jgi:hypothetical protein
MRRRGAPRGGGGSGARDDHIFFNPMGAVIVRALTQVSMAVDDQAIDWPTEQTRASSRVTE